MGRQRRIVAGAIAFGGFLVQLMNPELPWWIGALLLVGCAVVGGMAMFPEEVRSLGRRHPKLAPHVDRAITWLCVDGNEKTIPAGDAIRALMDASSHSAEATESRIRDQASIGKIRAWGKQIPADAIPLHLPSLEPIKAETWLYAQIDLNSIGGPLPSNRMRYLQTHANNLGPLYQAVRFNKAEIEIFCLAERLRR
jgi:hypothetical protein